jgi:hypothetical protein
MRSLLPAFAALLLAGCVTVSEGVSELSEVGSDAVLVVGRIELVPALRPDEQNIAPPNDLFNSKRYFLGRAVLFMSDEPIYRERTGHALNPAIGETFFLKVTRSQRFLVRGSVTMEMRMNSGRLEQTELLMPAPLLIDVRPGDQAVYIGTLRLHRDEFHEVTRAEVRDDYASAIVDFRRRFGAAGAPRKALVASAAQSSKRKAAR